MAGGQEIHIEGYKLRTSPVLWRKLTGDFWPYWQTSKPSFQLNVVRTGEDATEREIQLFIVLPNGHDVRRRVNIPRLKRKGKCNVPFEGAFLALTGDTYIIVEHELRVLELNSFPGTYDTFFSLNVTPKAWISLAMIAGVLAGLITTICQLLINANGQ